MFIRTFLIALVLAVTALPKLSVAEDAKKKELSAEQRRAILRRFKVDDPADLTVWPNRTSSANSDSWLVENHDKLRKMKPRVLFVNFCNGFSQGKAVKMAGDLVKALTEGTRYHGYQDPKAEPFVEWQVYKIIDLTDETPYPETPDGNSTKYPRSESKEGPNLQYKELYSEDFAKLLGFRDPTDRNHYLTLDELVDLGIIHEFWFFAYQRNAGAPFECTELKPVYDENFKRLGDQHRHSGNGGDPNEPWRGRSLRINFINAERGVGCNVESLSHSMEGMAHSGVIPYFRKYFYEYASFDLDKRFPGFPWNSFYPLWGEGKGVKYPDKNTAIAYDGEKEYRIDNYYCVGGNVHFTPNGRGHYDMGDTEPVMSTIEHYRLFDGPDGKDIAEPWTIAAFDRYRPLAPDCMGAWLVYWRQNMPGYANKCLDDDGKPIKNWWPFLFY